MSQKALTKFIHLTDTHCVNPGDNLYGLNPAQRLSAAIDNLLSEGHDDAEFVVVTGDLTHWGDPAAYQVFAEQMERLPTPVELVIGNHDNRQAFLKQFPSAHRDVNGFIQGYRDTPVGRCLFLDTVLAGTHAGAYCDKRLAWLDEQLGNAPGEVMLFMHHPPFHIGLPRLDTICLADHQAFTDVVLQHQSKVKHLFFGHVHRPLSGSWIGIPFSTLFSTNHQVAFSLDDDPQLTGSHEPPAYAVILAGHETLLVHTHQFMDRSPRYSMSSQQGDESREYATTMRFNAQTI